MYTALACRVHRPEYSTNTHSPHSFAFPPIHNFAAIDADDVPVPNPADGSETAVNTVSIFLPNSTYTASSDNSQNGPNYEQKCASDPVVQAVVARLNAGLHQVPYSSSCLNLLLVFTTAMGILSCLTTGWWGSVSVYQSLVGHSAQCVCPVV